MRNIVVTLARAGTLACALTTGAASAHAADISGAGATFPYPIYTKWADAYKKETNIGLNYQSIGSGGGIKQIKAKTVTFGATDAPLTGKDLEDSGLTQFPAVMGGIVPVVNLEGVKPGELVIDGPTLAKIFLGDIKSWDDPAIEKLNPSAKLPKQAIAIVHRSDGSGTTYNFAYYLAEVSPDWKTKVGVNTALQWPAGIGAKGNEGVANNVAQTKGSIGYVEYAYAKQNKLTFTKMINKDGKAVSADRGDLPGGRRQCRLEVAAGLRRDPCQPAGSELVADDRRDLDSHPQAAARIRRPHGGPQVLRLVLRQGRQDGRRARLRADARQGGQGRREDLGRGNQGHGRQAAVHELKRPENAGKGVRSAPFPSSSAACVKTVCVARS